MTPLLPVIATRLEKAAVDNGFDRHLAVEHDWLIFASTQCPLRLWLGVSSAGAFAAAFSQQNVGSALADFGQSLSDLLPTGAASARVVTDIPALHHLVRRAFQLAKSLPDELLHRFTDATRSLPRTTEAERLVVQRVGQDIFREGLMEYWEGRCAITGLAVPELLRASHIKPWAACETDAERLDVYNGLLLAAHVDALFDSHLMTFDDSGNAIFSARIDAKLRAKLGLTNILRIRQLAPEHHRFLAWHQRTFFSKAAPLPTVQKPQFINAQPPTA